MTGGSESDCSGHDVGEASLGSSTPDDARCTLADEGKAAVCWDGTTYSNSFEHTGEMFCRYKSVTAVSCTGGNNPGYKYECACRH